MSEVAFPRTPRLDNPDASALRAEIRRYFITTFDRYTALFDLLADDAAWFEKPISLRHPLIFYFGHTATFFVNKLVLARLVDERIDPQLESIFAVGVDEMSWDDLSEASYDWPSVDAARAYRAEVRALVLRLIDTLPLTPPISWEHPWWPIVMGVEHERIHIETSSVLIRQHALQRVKANADWQPCRTSGAAPQNTLVPIPAGRLTLGKSRDDPYYGWDNEYGQHEAEVSAFEAGQYLVSNGEFLAFVDVGGYATDEYWLEEGRSWKDFAQALHPTFWVRVKDGWRLRLMTEEISMPWDWPVEVNYHEAKAFCNWKRAQTGRPYRLPTEDEWYRMYDDSGAEGQPANLHLEHWASSCPVNSFRHGELYDVAGNVWQWTETPIYPFDGFEVHPFYDDFTVPTFDGRHNLIKGGSWVSCGNESLRNARYAFRRHFFQHAGFRYVVTEAPAIAPASGYETDELLSEYAEFHYGERYFGVDNFSAALAALAIEAMGQRPARSALDLGCATGRATFELARHFDQVTGVDFSARFIDLGVKLATQGRVRYTLVDEGELLSYRERNLAELGLAEIAHKVTFYQGDACNLKPQFGGYDLILAANLIDRLYSPAKFLGMVHERLNVGGLLLIASPYTWLEEHTPRTAWIGGFKRDGENVTTLDGLTALLRPHFRLLQAPRDVPFVIRETRRKFQHTVSEVTLWERIA